MHNIKITYFGIVRSISSWSKISRELINSLLKNGVDINIYERKGFLYDKNFKLYNEERLKFSNKFVGDIVFTFEHPINYKYLPDNITKIGFLVYEFTQLPELWVENINKHLNLVFVPSHFTYDVFLRSGVDEKKLRILRYGINPDYYYFDGRMINSVRSFLCVASPQKREGVDILLKAFYAAFKDRDDIRLTLKLSYNTDNSKPFEIPEFKKMISYYSNLLGKRLVVIDKKLSEKGMGDLYRNSDIYFSLTKAESFGLCFLEAIASGRWNICLDYSGQMDFLDENNSIFINHSIIETDSDLYEKTDYKQYIAMADIDDCVKKLKYLYNNQIAHLPQIKNGISHYYWDEISKEFLSIITGVNNHY
jgi:glycosyltransferase involved in cell wall biosynthesis